MTEPREPTPEDMRDVARLLQKARASEARSSQEWADTCALLNRDLDRHLKEYISLAKRYTRLTIFAFVVTWWVSTVAILGAPEPIYVLVAIPALFVVLMPWRRRW